MKTIKFLSMLAFASLLLISCSDDDDGEVPEEINEEEVITTMTVTLVPQGGGDTVTFQSRDLDGDGPDEPVITVSNLAGNTIYDGSIELLNETEDPAEDITEEIEEEDDEHQFFFTTTGSIAGVTYGDFDGDGNPLGLAFELETNTAGAASLTITLQHEPTKPNDGTVTGAGGETDIAQTFSFVVE